jgi:hypothetical protein
MTKHHERTEGWAADSKDLYTIGPPCINAQKSVLTNLPLLSAPFSRLDQDPVQLRPSPDPSPPPLSARP